ncbi:MAG: cardiolipin synthase [Syntrophobacteraceae bacterium]
MPSGGFGHQHALPSEAFVFVSIKRSTALKSALLFVSLFFLLPCGCVSLPNTSKLIKESQRTCIIPKVVGPKRQLSSRQSNSLIERLRQQSLPTSFLDRHIRVEEQLCGTPLIAGNDVRLLVDGPATYDAMAQAIRNARDHINIETYIFKDDEIGRDFAELLLQKRTEGVAVNLIYDGIGSRSTSSDFFQKLRDGGINLLEFNPLNPLLGSGRWKLTHRDHRKILVVDGSLAITGGVNITSDYSPSVLKSTRRRKERYRTFWRDTDVQIEGPAVAEFQKLFLDTWRRQEGPNLPERDYFPVPVPRGNEVVRVIGSSPDTKNGLTFMMYIAAISFAQKSVHLTNSYFVPDKQMLRALTGAAKRGVDVKLILPASSDSPMAIYAGRSHYRRLMEAGVKLYEHTTTILHAKTAVIDGVWSSVGSTNMDLWSFVRNDEVNAVILGLEFAEQMETMFQKDLENSREITLEAWKKRPFRERVKEWLARRLSYWL